MLLLRDLIVSVLFAPFVFMSQVQDMDFVLINIYPKRERQAKKCCGNSTVWENDLGMYWRWMFNGTEMEFNKELYAKAFKNLYDKDVIKL
jgi:hypothetical protein